jgi:uncharacterized protein YkwD
MKQNYFRKTFPFSRCMTILIALVALTSFSRHPDKGIVVDKTEALKAFDLLNDIRSHSEKYYSEFPYLSDPKVQHSKLTWNKTLVRVAEAKAFDMADKNYMAHVDRSGCGINYYIRKAGYHLNREWTNHRSKNNFESLAAGFADGETSIRGLIIDEGVPSLGHRRHLLGLSKWDAGLKDIGIGFVTRKTGSKYQTYCVVIIAKHNWSKEELKEAAAIDLKYFPKGSHWHWLFRNRILG